MGSDTGQPSRIIDYLVAQECEAHGARLYYEGTIPPATLDGVSLSHREVKHCPFGCQYIDGRRHKGFAGKPIKSSFIEDL